MRRISRSVRVGAALLVPLLLGCSEASVPSDPSPHELVMAPLSGNAALDREIARLQRALARTAKPIPVLERLGWRFIGKALASSDPGFYRLAEQAALAIDEIEPGRADAELLRGHALHGLHRFPEAEALARRLVAQRGLSFDFGLLGDALVDQGRLEEGAAAYQAMMDRRPDAHAYARAAHLRFLTGDVTGARSAMELAARAVSPHDAVAYAWILSRLALYRLQLGDAAGALADGERALRVAPDALPALYARGRILLGLGRAAEAVAPLEHAAQAATLPELLWTLEEALAASGQPREASAVRKRLLATGEGSDPRGLALYLAARGQDLPRALALARREIHLRADAYTYDVLAWVEAASGRIDSARRHEQTALAAGIRDARIYYHAAVIAARAGAFADARHYRRLAHELAPLLLPSQRRALEELSAKGARSATQT